MNGPIWDAIWTAICAYLLLTPGGRKALIGVLERIIDNLKTK